MTKREQLLKLREEMLADEGLPLRKGATKLVFGQGDPDTEILFIGEGPGYWEDQKGLPFVGNAGNLLNKLLESIDLKREDVFITNMVHHRPPENRDPGPPELESYAAYLDRIIDAIAPKVIVTLGRFSMAKFIPFVTISAVHGKPHPVEWKNEEIMVVPMYHPAAALRRGEIMQSIKADFARLPQILEKTKQPPIEDKNDEEDGSGQTSLF